MMETRKPFFRLSYKDYYNGITYRELPAVIPASTLEVHTTI